MIITTETIKNFKPCKDRLYNYLGHYSDREFTLEEFLGLTKITHTDKMWVSVRLMNHSLQTLFACRCAESALHTYEKYNPDSSVLRNAIGCARDVIKNPGVESTRAAADAANAANVAARAARNAADADAAKAAADAANAAAYAATAAAYAAYAATAAADAATAAADAAAKAAGAIKAASVQEDVYLSQYNLIVQILGETK